LPDSRVLSVRFPHVLRRGGGEINFFFSGGLKLHMPNPNPDNEWSFVLDGVEKTISLARELAAVITAPGVVAFFGGLGSGKTTFIQALGAGLGHTGAITSPSYTIINRYEGARLPLVHVDCYRIKAESELDEIGLDEIFAGDCLVCVEWSDRVLGLLPQSRLEIHLTGKGRAQREVKILLLGDIWPRLRSQIPLWLERNF